MFQACLSQVSTIKKIIDSLKDLVSEVNIEATHKGLSLQAMDSAHVSLVALQLNEEGFETFRCDKPITLGINLVDLAKILKMAANEDKLTLKADEDHSFLNISFENKKTERSVEFLLNLLTLDAENLGIPDTDYPTSVKMSSSEFVRLCRDSTQLAETINIQVKDRTAIFSFSGKSGSGRIILKNNNAEKIEDQVIVECQEEISSNYGLTYLNSFAKASSLSTTVKLFLSSQYPLMIEYDIDNMGFMKFYLAPKMD